MDYRELKAEELFSQYRGLVNNKPKESKENEGLTNTWLAEMFYCEGEILRRLRNDN